MQSGLHPPPLVCQCPYKPFLQYFAAQEDPTGIVHYVCFEINWIVAMRISTEMSSWLYYSLVLPGMLKKIVYTIHI